MSSAFPPARARAAAALTDAALLAECEEQFFVASGPGGQNRNKRETGVRLVHRPSGVTVSATERRSQLQNRAAALERLRTKLIELGTEQAPRRPTKIPRAAKRRRLEDKKHHARKKAARVREP